MITADNFQQALCELGFEQEGNTYIKVYDNNSDCVMSVDFENKKLNFPKQILNNERNNGFNAPENFVVFECVCRLLEKGYRPEHIELEKSWTLGHEQKSGRADIIVYEPDSSGVLFIVECKTAGNEFKKAWNDTKADGGQVFSYWQQERSTKWLALYTSDFIDGEVTYKCNTISCSDDANILEMAKKAKNTDVLLFKNAFTANEKFEVWKETYNSKHYDNLIFSEDNVAYKVGVSPLRKKDLEDFRPEDKIVNQFEEILRHNNVSDKENAFNRLVALFICKLVDEIKKQDTDEVEFQYKQGSDTYETLQDRLQRLHKEGMEEFMKEKIFYVKASYAEDLFKQYTGKQRKAAINDLNNTIRILKFYSNNDFAFKDVHNEELFFQNGKILVEIVELFQKYRIVYPSKHQFLGDLFEQLLNKGFKQNEGQFFTPMPITRFIWDCLPLQEYISENALPRVIDYACGAGHFLTEAIEAINAVRKNGDNSWVEKHIFGIEKDYRLARVSKVSMFMNGAGGSQIIFGDGLDNNSEKGISNTSFDILVANPPYSVSAFKSHLKLKNNFFDLLAKISNDGSEIETLFVERIAQLLKPKGIAAVVLPSSILSNNSGSYEAAREKILGHFMLRTIVCFGSKTFGATGTNTIVLFLEKYDEPPVQLKLANDVAEAILKGDVSNDWEDAEVFGKYIQKISVDKDSYLNFAHQKLSLIELQKIEYFKEYVVTFKGTKQTYPKKLNEQEIQIEELRRFYQYAKGVESEKLKFFTLTCKQTTLVITAPSDNAEQKTFLGYDWSNRKGAEGIVINTPGGKLYNDKDRFAQGTLASMVRNTFAAKQAQLSEDLAKYTAYYALVDMLDFSRPVFDKSIRTTAIKKVEVQSKYPLVKLGEVVDISRGVTYSKDDQVIEPTSNIILTADNVTLDGSFEINKQIYIDKNVKLAEDKRLKENDLFMCFSSGSLNHVGKVALIKTDTNYYAGGFMGILRTKENAIPQYIHSILNTYSLRKEMQSESSGSNIKNLTNAIGQIQIPLPPMKIQQQIVAECEAIDKQCEEANKKIEAKKAEIENLYSTLYSKAIQEIRLSDKEYFNLSIGRRVLNSEVREDYDIPVYSANVFEPFGKINKLLLEDFSVASVLWGIDGDWMVNCLPKEQKFYPTDHCGVIRIKDDKINPKYLAWALEKKGTKERFSRSFRASTERISALTLKFPPLTEQNKIVKKIETLEEEIAELLIVSKGAKERKEEVLHGYLE